MSETEDRLRLHEYRLHMPTKIKPIPTDKSMNEITELNNRVTMLENKLDGIMHILSGRQFMQRSVSFESDTK